jgi:hypothetical protein
MALIAFRPSCLQGILLDQRGAIKNLPSASFASAVNYYKNFNHPHRKNQRPPAELGV